MSAGADEEEPQSSSAVLYRPLVSQDYDDLFSDISEAGPSNKQPSRAELSEAPCENLESLLKSIPFNLKELDLRSHSLKESDVELLCSGLESPQCQLETLRLGDCVLSERCCAALVSLLQSNPSYLTELDLSGNKSLKDSGVKLLSVGLGSSHCRLRILRLVDCGLTENSCASLRSAFTSNPYFKELDLSENSLQDAGIESLLAGLNISSCFLNVLRLRFCGLSATSCYCLSSILKMNYSLQELDLSWNWLQDSGMKLLSTGLRDNNFLKILRLVCCSFSDEGCAALVSVLGHTRLIELDLSRNDLKHQGMKMLDGFVKSSHCYLDILRVDDGRNLIATHSDRGDVSRQSATSRLNQRIKEYRKWIQLKAEQLKAPSASTTTDSSVTEGKYPLKKSSMDVSFPQTPTASLPEQSCSPMSELDRILDALNESTMLETEKLKDMLLLPPVEQSPFGHSSPPSKGSDYFSGLSESPDKSGVMPPIDHHDFELDSGKVNTKLDRSEEQVQSCFLPELTHEHGVTSYRFSGPCPGVFYCKLAKLGFTMTQEGKLLYKIIQWDESLLQSTGKIPASPLFKIEGSEDAVSQLHLPHCEGKPASHAEGLSVVHISDDGMSILEPMKITDTHVVLDVHHFSAFGLVWDIITRFLSFQKPVSGQVLLFHRPTCTRKSQKLNVFLLPENVPLQEVKGQQENAEYLEAPSFCHLFKSQAYFLQCHQAYRVQPVRTSFDPKYGPNYHPTFEIRLTQNTEEATVTVRDQDERCVWEYHVELTGVRPGSSSSSTTPSIQPPANQPANQPAMLSSPAEDRGPDSRTQSLGGRRSISGEEQKLLSVRTQFINRVSKSVLKDLLDVLLQRRVISSSEKEDMQNMSRRDKATELIDMVRKKGQLACKILIEAFCEVDPFLSQLLQLGVRNR